MLCTTDSRILKPKPDHTAAPLGFNIVVGFDMSMHFHIASDFWLITKEIVVTRASFYVHPQDTIHKDRQLKYMYALRSGTPCEFDPNEKKQAWMSVASQEVHIHTQGHQVMPAMSSNS